jgi:hypothetical protein
VSSEPVQIFACQLRKFNNNFETIKNKVLTQEKGPGGEKTRKEQRW